MTRNRRPTQDQRSPEAAAYRKWYRHARWLRMRAKLLAEEPRCRHCRKLGRDTLATVADHIKPHRGDPRLFWDYMNLQPLCDDCHNEKGAVEMGFRPKAEISFDGWPRR
jgi:5-methylcytosine-specific restriction protein A